MSVKDINAFLDWFGGFSENIDEVPTAKQWGRLKERITAIPRLDETVISALPAASAQTPALEPGAVLPNGRVFMDEVSWRRALKDALDDMDCDQSATLVSQEIYDGRIDPAVVARMIYSVE